MNRIIRWIILVCGVILAVACSTSAMPESVDEFDGLLPLPLSEMNVKIRAFFPEDANSFKSGDLVALAIENLSGSKVVLPPDYGLRLFALDQDTGEWVEISNKGQYVPQTPRQISPRLDGYELPGTILTSLQPDIQVGTVVTMRVFVIGTMYDGDTPTDELVGAYADVTLNP